MVSQLMCIPGVCARACLLHSNDVYISTAQPNPPPLNTGDVTETNTLAKPNKV